jgi:hypothetical protein
MGQYLCHSTFILLLYSLYYMLKGAWLMSLPDHICQGWRIRIIGDKIPIYYRNIEFQEYQILKHSQRTCVCNQNLMCCVTNYCSYHLYIGVSKSEYKYYAETNQKLDVPHVLWIANEVVPCLKHTDTPQPAGEAI